MCLTWKFKRFPDQSFPLGQLHLNKLRDIKKIKGDPMKFSRIGIEEADDGDSGDECIGES
jgi:hypothetical protein